MVRILGDYLTPATLQDEKIMVPSFIAVDIGNTKVHFGRFEGFRAAEVTPPISTFAYSTASSDLKGLRNWLGEAALPWYVVSVHRPGLASLEALAKIEPRVASFTAFTHATLPIETALAQPERVGTDRLAAAVAANHLRKADQPAVVVDAGTAITVDAVSAEGKFLGGAILPGMRLVAAALASRTDALPLVTVDPQNAPKSIGTNTEEAMQSGLFWGSVGAVAETIRRVSQQLGTVNPPQVFFSGGDVHYLAPWIDLPIETVDHLVLKGIALAAQQVG